MRVAGAAEPAAARQTLPVLLNSCTCRSEGEGQLLRPVPRGERLAWGQEATGEREGNQMLFPFALQKPSWLQGTASRQEERPKRQLSANMPRGWLQPIDPLPLPSPG